MFGWIYSALLGKLRRYSWIQELDAWRLLKCGKIAMKLTCGALLLTIINKVEWGLNLSSYYDILHADSVGFVRTSILTKNLQNESSELRIVRGCLSFSFFSYIHDILTVTIICVCSKHEMWNLFNQIHITKASWGLHSLSFHLLLQIFFMDWIKFTHFNNSI